MAYRMTVKKANGDVERTRVDGDSETSFVQRWEGTRGVVVKDNTPRKVGYNFGGGANPSRARRVEEIRDDLNRQRVDLSQTRGFSGDRTMRKVASIPPELWWSEKAENGPEALRNPKDLKKFCQKWQLNVTEGW